MSTKYGAWGNDKGIQAATLVKVFNAMIGRDLRLWGDTPYVMLMEDM